MCIESVDMSTKNSAIMPHRLREGSIYKCSGYQHRRCSSAKHHLQVALLSELCSALLLGKQYYENSFELNYGFRKPIKAHSRNPGYVIMVMDTDEYSPSLHEQCPERNEAGM